MRGVARWTDPGWRAEHLAWASAALAGLGRRVVGEPEQRARPWGTVFRVETDDGRVVWSKANGPGTAHEARLLSLLQRRGGTLPLAPIAGDLDRGWLITDDAGPTLRAMVNADGRPGDQDMAVWSDILPIYAAFQRGVAPAADDMLGAGVPDERPARYPDMLAGLLADVRIWTRVDAADRQRTDAARRRLVDLTPFVAELAAALEASAVPASLDHGDLHGNNLVPVADGSFRLFDWGDAVVAHPFATLTTTLGSIGYHAGVDPYGPVVAPVRDAYLSAWADIAPVPELDRVATHAMDVGHIGKAAAWERALLGLEPDEMAGFHGATAAWLADLADRLEARSAGR